MIQAQNGLLNDGASPLPVDERVQILQDKQEAVDAFRCLQKWLDEDVCLPRLGAATAQR